MESGGRLFFNHSTSHGNMLFLGNADPIFRGPRTMISMEETAKRRPFFSSPEDLYDEEYYNEQLPEKKRRLTAEQVHLLEKSFETENKLEPERKTQLAKKVGLQPRQVAVWFQNRRARWKNKQLEKEYDLLKSCYDTLVSNYDSILKDNEKLKSELASLTEKLQAKDVTADLVVVSQKVELEPLPVEMVTSGHFNVKLEDRLSTGSTGSAVVDEDAPQLVDSGDSYFPSDEYPGCLVHSEEDDGSDDGQSYFSNVFTAAEQQQQHEERWWVWS